MKLVPGVIGRQVARQALLAQKNSPTLLFGAGVIGMVGSTVLACRATLRLEQVLLSTNRDLKAASENDSKKDIAVTYTTGAAKVVKLYSPAVLVGVASIGCLTKSHNMLNQRNLALTAAYAAVDRAFNEYRARVIDKYGEEQDREFRYATEEVELLDERGKMTTVTRVNSEELPSMYARFFDSYSGMWSKDPQYNYVFLRCQQQWANDMLKARGHLFLNEVYDALALDRTTAGSVVGWVISRDGDNFVDFGIFDDEKNARDFINGREGSILLDFNVDGIIYDKINQSMERIRWQS
jgi:Family of unknown function (DUF6353)